MTRTNILKIGDSAPLFTLEDQNGKKVALADFKHKKNVVLIFYPGDMTPGCTMQLCAIRDDYGKFAKADAVVFGVNHGDASSHKAFIKKNALPFPLLIDKGKKISLKFGAVKSFFKAKIIKRKVAVVDKEGKIIYLRHGMPTDVEIIKAIKKI